MPLDRQANLELCWSTGALTYRKGPNYWNGPTYYRNSLQFESRILSMCIFIIIMLICINARCTVMLWIVGCWKHLIKKKKKKKTLTYHKFMSQIHVNKNKKENGMGHMANQTALDCCYLLLIIKKPEYIWFLFQNNNVTSCDIMSTSNFMRGYLSNHCFAIKLINTISCFIHLW